MVCLAPRPKKKRTLMSPTTVTLTRSNFRLILPGDPCSILLWRDGQPPYDQDSR